jgi:hypothetical protein
MADFHTLVASEVSTLDSNTPETRQAVYERARAVVQMLGRNRALPEADMAHQMLENAIGLVEALCSQRQKDAEPFLLRETEWRSIRISVEAIRKLYEGREPRASSGLIESRDSRLPSDK